MLCNGTVPHSQHNGRHDEDVEVVSRADTKVHRFWAPTNEKFSILLKSVRYHTVRAWECNLKKWYIRRCTTKAKTETFPFKFIQADCDVIHGIHVHVTHVLTNATFLSRSFSLAPLDSFPLSGTPQNMRSSDGFNFARFGWHSLSRQLIHITFYFCIRVFGLSGCNFGEKCLKAKVRLKRHTAHPLRKFHICATKRDRSLFKNYQILSTN